MMQNIINTTYNTAREMQSDAKKMNNRVARLLTMIGAMMLMYTCAACVWVKATIAIAKAKHNENKIENIWNGETTTTILDADEVPADIRKGNEPQGVVVDLGLNMGEFSVRKVVDEIDVPQAILDEAARDGLGQYIARCDNQVSFAEM